VDQVARGKVVGVDPTVVTAADARKLADKIKKKGGDYKAVEENLIDLVWAEKRPARPSENVIVQQAQHAGRSFDDKIADIRKELEKKKSLGFVASLLDEIAWLYNLRGSEYVRPTQCDTQTDLPQYSIQPSLLFVCGGHTHASHPIRRR
jgi:Xaa-Pro aminopeptidase